MSSLDWTLRFKSAAFYAAFNSRRFGDDLDGRGDCRRFYFHATPLDLKVYAKPSPDGASPSQEAEWEVSLPILGEWVERKFHVGHGPVHLLSFGSVSEIHADQIAIRIGLDAMVLHLEKLDREETQRRRRYARRVCEAIDAQVRS